MRIFGALVCGMLGLLSQSLYAENHLAQIERIIEQARKPEAYLKAKGPLVTLGSAPLSSAKIVFLPEVHDDPDSLTTQLLLLEQERAGSRPFIVLDESLESMKKSMWDIFSQKSLEIIAASDQRREKEAYMPHRFEAALQSLANKFKSQLGKLLYLEDSRLWTLSDFVDRATPFYGWDLGTRGSLVDRNVQMVKSLKAALKNNDRVLVMAGARHVPELEFLSSQRLLCQDSRFSNMETYFSAIESRFGDQPTLRYGIGASVPIHNFLSKQKYAIVFNKDLYNELEQVVAQFKAKDPRTCFKLSK